MILAQQCPSETALEHLAAGTPSPDELRIVIAHLLRGCPACGARLRELVRRPVPEGAYEGALDRFEEGLRTALEAPVGPLSRLWTVVQEGPRRCPNVLSDLQGGGPARAAAQPPASPAEPAPQPPPSRRIPLPRPARRLRLRSIGSSFE